MHMLGAGGMGWKQMRAWTAFGVMARGCTRLACGCMRLACPCVVVQWRAVVWATDAKDDVEAGGVVWAGVRAVHVGCRGGVYGEYVWVEARWRRRGHEGA